VTPSPAIFDFDKLNWLNRHYIKLADPERITKLAERQFCLQKPGVFPLWTTSELYTAETIALLASLDPPIYPDIPSSEMIAKRKAWFRSLIALFLPGVDHLAQLPVKSAFIFGIDPDAAHAEAENAAILNTESARTVLSEFAAVCDAERSCDARGLQEMDQRDQGGDGNQGQGTLSSHSHCAHRLPLRAGFDKVIPLIEEGAELGLPIPTVHDRIEQFVGV